MDKNKIEILVEELGNRIAKLEKIIQERTIRDLRIEAYIKAFLFSFALLIAFPRILDLYHFAKGDKEIFQVPKENKVKKDKNIFEDIDYE